MKETKLLLKILFSVFLFSRLSAGLCAEDNYYAAQTLCEYAISLYELGNTEEAKYEFRKVLVIDPENATAKRYLEKIGLSRGEILEERVKVYENALQNKNEEIAALTEELRLKEIALKNAQVQASRLIEPPAKVGAKPEGKDLDRLILEIKTQKMDLTLKNEELMLQKEKLNSVVAERDKLRAEKDGLLKDLERLAVKGQKAFAEKEAIIKDLTQQLELSRGALKEAGKRAPAKAGKLTKEPKPAEEKEAQLRQLKEQLRAIRVEFRKMQKLSAEKDALIKDLESRLESTKADPTP